MKHTYRRLACLLICIFTLSHLGSVTVVANPSSKPFLQNDITPLPYVGVWEGTGLQYNNGQTWSIRITLDAGQVGSISGTIAYPSLQCGGELTLLEVTEEFIKLAEDITYGGNCVDNGTITMRLADDHTVDWKWSFEDGML